MRLFFLVAFFAASPLLAQSLDPRYRSVGKFEGSFGETAFVLNSLFDLEKDRSAVKLRDASGFSNISIRARIIGEDGKPTNPSVTFTVGPIRAGGSDVRTDVFYNDATGYYATDNDIGGRVSLSDYEQNDTSVSFSIEAPLQPVKRGGDGFVVDESRVSRVISGTFSGTMTDVD